MAEKMLKITVFRFDPATDEEPRYETYDVPYEPGMSAMDALDHIYHHLDGTVAYYDHAGCSLGICGRCTGRINGRPGLFCQTIIHENATLEPLSQDRVLKDLVVVRDSADPAKPAVEK